MLKAFFSNAMCVRVILSFLREDCGKKEDGELQKYEKFFARNAKVMTEQTPSFRMCFLDNPIKMSF